jgi:acetyl esterase/lipase
LSGAAAAAQTANVLAPPTRGRAAPLGFAFGMVPSELPIPTAILQAATGAFLARKGGARGWRGKLGLAAYGASLAGLGYAQYLQGKSASILEQALVDELGTDYRRRITEAFVPRPEVPLSRRQIVLPASRLFRPYRTARDISYGDAGRRNHLDVWRRADLPADAKAPVLLQFHGSGWSVASKEHQAEPLMAHLAERGWVCVTANYRLSPRATWPDHIVDVKRALAWTKANVAAHGGDPDFVVITGGSAGGHLASLAALTPNLADFQPGFEDADTTVAACVPFYGVYDFVNRHGTSSVEMEDFVARMVFKSKLARDRDRWEQASTISHVRADAPPFFVIHGTTDSLVPVGQARTFVDELRKESTQPVVYAELPGAQHAFDVFPSVRTNACAHAVERFLAVVRSEHNAAT